MAQALQLLPELRASISLDLDGALPHGSAGAQQLLELAGQGLQFVFVERQPGDAGHGLAAPTAAQPLQADDAISGGGRRLPAAALTLPDGLLAIGTQAAVFGGIDPCHDGSLHGWLPGPGVPRSRPWWMSGGGV